MSTSSQISLGALRLQAQQRTSMENNNAITTAEWNSYATSSYKELYDLLTAAYGNDYYLANLYQFTTSSSQTYPLPDGTPTYQDVTGATAAKFYKLLGVDLQYTGSPSGFISLQRFEMIERNKYAYPNTTTNLNGYTNLKYRISGNNLYVIPVPTSGQVMRLWYAPAPTNLQFMLPVVTASSGTIGSLSDTTGLTVGMNAYASGVFPSNTTISAVGSTSVTFSNAALANNASATVSFWNDSTLLEGIAGWEEYVILDMAIKCQIKQEFDATGFAAQKLEMKQRIEAMAEGRDAGQAQHVSDALSVNVYGPGGFGGIGYGDGWGGL